MPSMRRSIPAALLPALALVGLAATPALADQRATLKNSSRSPWTFRVVDDGGTVGGKLQFNHPGYSPNSSTFTIEPGASIPFTFSYRLSYQVRFQLVDKNGNWAEFQSGLGATSSFSGSRRYTHLFNSIFYRVKDGAREVFQDPEGVQVAKVLAMDSPKNGDIEITGDCFYANADRGQAAQVWGELKAPDSKSRAELKAPFWSTYWFNPTEVTFKVFATRDQVELSGKEALPPPGMVILDLDGKELGRLPNGPGQPLVLPPKTMVRVVYLPDAKGLCNIGVKLVARNPDVKGKAQGDSEFHLAANTGNLWPNTSYQVSPAASDVAVTLRALRDPADPNKVVVLDQFPGHGDLTFKKDQFPLTWVKSK